MFETVVQRHTVAPVYNQEFVFKEVTASSLEEISLM